MGGPGLERVWNAMDGVWNETARSSTALTATAADLYQNWQFGARVAQQAILRLPAGSTQAHFYHQTAQPVPQRAARRREGQKQSILRLPTGSSQAHPYQHNKVGSSCKCCRHRLANTITELGHRKGILACMHSCTYVRTNVKIRLHMFKYVYLSIYYIYINACVCVRMCACKIYVYIYISG